MQNASDRRKIMHIRFWWESQKERDQSEDLEVGEVIILIWIFESADGMSWIHLAQDTGQRRALVNTEMNLRVP
jgi:hypothetical protein